MTKSEERARRRLVLPLYTAAATLRAFGRANNAAECEALAENILTVYDRDTISGALAALDRKIARAKR